MHHGYYEPEDREDHTQVRDRVGGTQGGGGMRIIRRVVALNDVRQRACKNSSSLPTHPRFACRSSRSLHLASNVNVRTSLITNKIGRAHV